MDSSWPKANAAREYLDKHNLVEFTQLLVQSVSCSECSRNDSPPALR